VSESTRPQFLDVNYLWIDLAEIPMASMIMRPYMHPPSRVVPPSGGSSVLLLDAMMKQGIAETSAKIIIIG
jgi:hypothetical protein